MTFETNVENELIARRDQFAMTVTRYVVWLAGLILVGETVLWLLFSQYTQIFAHLILIAIIVSTAAAYRPLYRAGYGRFGISLFLVSLFFILIALPFVIPNILPTVTMAFVLLGVLATMLMGKKASWGFILLTIPGTVFVMVVERTWTFSIFPPLDPTLALVLSGSLILSTLFMSSLIIRTLVVGQEDQFREVQLSKREIEHRSLIEQQQNERLQHINDEIEQRAAVEQQQRENLQHLINQIHETVLTLNSAATEIMAATTQQSASSTEQDAIVTQTSAIVEEVRNAVKQAAERAENVADAAQKSVEISRAGQQAVGNTMEGMKTIRQHMESIANTILMLSERTQQIGEIITTVNEIANQSKLLALNASIEAARASEEGRGFAVVAMEVRQLAEQSRNATARVKTILQEIQQVTNTAVMVTEEGNKGADNSLILVERAGVSIQQLSADIEAAARTAIQIANINTQQINSMNQLATMIASIRQATLQTSSGARQTETSVRNLSEMARQLELTIQTVGNG